MEMSVKAAEVMVPPKPDVASSSASSSSSSDSAEGEAAPPAACGPSSDYLDPMEKFSRRLQDIISAYGSAAGALDRQRTMEAEMEKMEEPKDDITAATEADVSAIMQSLNQFSSAQDKVEEVVRRYAELAACRRCGERRLDVLQQRASVLLEEARGGGAARGLLEGLCRELQGHYSVLREETLQQCKEDEEKRREMVNHFQGKLTEIQAQIEQHSVRNDKLCRENGHLTDKLESLMGQCELREESLEKINKRRDLQQKLSEAKLLQANALLTEAEEKHTREKEYLLREAIDKTKKCFAMKEQELAMKKKLLVQAAEWKLQAQTLREQGTVMQAQLTLYAQKFDEFQETLAKSNQIYSHFKKEMDNMTEKMKKMEKESNLWKTRFENCNKALTDMMEERKEKVQEYDMFILKIQKLERLCRALQDERVVLYNKIKEVRRCNASIPPKESGSRDPDNIIDAEDADKSALMQELQEVQDQDPVLTEDMSRLREEQAKLQEFAASLLATPSLDMEEDSPEVDNEEDEVAAAFVQFKSKPQVTEEAGSTPEQEVQEKPEEPVLLDEERQKPAAVPAPSETRPADVKAQEVTVQPQVEGGEVQPRKPDEEVQEKPEEPVLLDEERQKPAAVPAPSETRPADVKAQEVTVQPQVEGGEVQPRKPDEEVQEKPEEPVLLDEERQKPAAVPAPSETRPADVKAQEVTVQPQVEGGELQPRKPDEEVQEKPEEPVLLDEERQKPAAVPAPSETRPADVKAQEVTVQPQVEGGEVQPRKPDEEVQQQPPEPEPEKVQIDPPADLKPAAEAEISTEAGEVKPAQEDQVQVQPSEAPTGSESAPSSNTSRVTESSSSDASRKQTPKKKKKRSGKNAS